MRINPEKFRQFFSKEYILRRPLLSVHMGIRHIFRHLRDMARARASENITPYFRNIYAQEIFSSEPVSCSAPRGVETHMLICERDITELLWCIKTLVRLSKIDIQLFLHDDGSLSKHSIEIIASHLKGAKIISKTEADTRIRPHLEGFPFSTRYRFTESNPFALRLFDFMIYAKERSILTVDADVLFFGSAEEIAIAVKEDKPFFLNDHFSAYAYSGERSKALFDITPPPRVNAGLLYFNISAWNIDLIERLLKRWYADGQPEPWWIEQTIFALLIGNSPTPFHRLGRRYHLCMEPLRAGTRAAHFVGSHRAYFYSEGLRRLRRLRFLEKLR